MQETEQITMGIEATDDSENVKSQRGRRRNRWMAVLTFTSIGGIVTGLTGLLLSALSLFGVIDATGRLHGSTTVLIVIAFVSLSLAAHALDKISEIEKGKK
jgi:small-conductance mechanosensitive channel